MIRIELEGTNRQISLETLITRELKYHDKGNDVKALQIALCLLGYYPCTSFWIDGDFGQKTYSAVIKFQVAHNLHYDEDVIAGHVRLKTIRKLQEELEKRGLWDDFIKEAIKYRIISEIPKTPEKRDGKTDTEKETWYPDTKRRIWYPDWPNGGQHSVPEPFPTWIPLLIIGGAGLFVYLLLK